MNRFTIKGQHVWTIIPFFKTAKIKMFLSDPVTRKNSVRSPVKQGEASKIIFYCVLYEA